MNPDLRIIDVIISIKGFMDIIATFPAVNVEKNISMNLLYSHIKHTHGP